ncbi:MAG TPA: hypothetical protein PKA37_07195, partial [Planctomycetota bacterium]|nr:hypothetical protein [Planctomycetota bacterium]
MENGIKQPLADRSHRWFGHAALLLVLAGQFLSHTAWFDRDARIPFWDQERYFDMTRTAYERLRMGDVSRVFDLHPSHPPLYSLLGAAYQGSGELTYDHARRMNIWFRIATTLLTFALSRRLGLAQLEAVFAAALSALFPLAYSFGHMYYIENLLTPLVLGGLILLWPPGPKSLKAAAFTGFVLGLGCLCKWTAPIFLVVPALATLWVNRKQVGHIAVATVVFAATLGPWYLTHWQGILSFLNAGVTAGEGNLSAIRGFEAVAYYPAKLLFLGIGPFAGVIALLGLVRFWRRDARQAGLLLLVIVAAVIIFSAILTKKPRHLLPLLPCLAVLVASGTWALRSPPKRYAVLAILIGSLVLANAGNSFGIPKSLPEWRIGGLTVPLLARSSGAGINDARLWPYDAMLDGILLSPPSPSSKEQALVLFNLVPFREGGFRYHIQNRHLPLWCSLIPFAGLVENDRFPLHRTDEETPGLLDLPPL